MDRTEKDVGRGYVPTPPALVDFMVRLAPPTKPSIRVLEPGCADAPFLRRYRERYGPKHQLIGVEIHEPTVKANQRKLEPIEIRHADFLLWYDDYGFDVIIGNPPWGVIGDESHYGLGMFKEKKGWYKRLYETWRGKYNIYGLFMEHAVELLKSGGRLVFVVPVSWMVLDDFRNLRIYLSRHGGIEIFYLGYVFQDVRLAVGVVRFTKSGSGMALYDLSRGVWKEADVISSLENYLVCSDSFYAGGWIRFESEPWLRFERQGVPLGAVFDIHFAARSTEFLARGAVSHVPDEGLVPVLSGRNLAPGVIDYDRCYTKMWMRREEAIRLRPFYGAPHLVVAHTKGARCVAAWDDRCYPWREEFHLVPKESFEISNPQALVAYLNSAPVQEYLENMYRQMVPHLTRLMLERIPLPTHLFRTAIAHSRTS